MGNSRIDVGIDPDSRALGGAAYNLAVPGTGVGTARHQFAQLLDGGARPSTLVLGVEFFDFLLDPKRAEPPVRALPGGLARQRWWLDTALSLDALADAARTLAIQHDRDAATMSARGFNPLSDYLPAARRDGYQPFFQQRALENARRFSLVPRAVVVPGTDSSADWRELGGLLDAAAEQNATHGTDIKLVIYPYHAQLLAMLESSGLWPVYEQWKLRLLREVARVRAVHPQARIAVWDFSGYGARQCERIPTKGDLAVTTWYWESGHFKAALGEAMLARMFGSTQTEDFGFLLNAGNWNANRERIARERAACAAREPAMFREAAALVARFADAKKG